MSFNLLRHGDVRNLKVKVGKDSFVKRVKYCVRHGWSDLFMAGGESGWNSRYALCNQKPITGAEIVETKVLAKAA